VAVAFVPAFRPCETAGADARHGAPLDFPSCANPEPASSTARIGPNTLSIARIVVCAQNSTAAFCNPAGGALPKPDVRLTGSIRDVRCAQTGKAAVWQLGQIELRDSGPDGVRGNADDELFATQGVFLP